ncbi:MAG: zinc ribbon domain-containing protein [Erysipelotrichaceae bacterium]|nr:zinc ribbon domain-containing protein [Erysipelotrichaceae bacterium]
MTDFLFEHFDAIFTIMLVITLLGFGFVIVSIFSPTVRSKMMGRQIRMTKRVLDDNYDTIRDLSGTAADLGVDIQKDIYDRHEDDYHDLAKRKASVYKDADSDIAKAMKEGFSDSSRRTTCRYCGQTIDADSRFCNHCGKQQ